MIKYEKQTTTGADMYYEILDNGFHIYIGSTVRPMIVQEEPFIPHPELSYEENAKLMCEEYCGYTSTDNTFEDRLTNVESNIDYLMLLNDPDSAAEATE